MAFDPDQPRDSFGRWTDSGSTTEAIRAAASNVKTVPLNADDPEIIKASMDKWFNEDLPKLEDGIDIKHWVNEYTTDFFRDFNYNLRTGNDLTPDQYEAVKHIDKAIELNPNPFKGTVYRGMGFSSEETYNSFKKAVETGVIEQNAYTSTSYNPEVPKRKEFSGEDKKFAVQMTIKSNKGLLVKSVSAKPDQDEVILKRRANLAVVGKPREEITDDRRTLFLTLEETE